MKHEHLSRLGLTLKVKNQWGSYAYYDKRLIIIAKAGLSENHYKGVALVTHEVAHIVTRHKNGYHLIKPHGSEFKRQETRLLKLFGLTIERDKANAKALYLNGVEVWHK